MMQEATGETATPGQEKPLALSLSDQRARMLMARSLSSFFMSAIIASKLLEFFVPSSI